MGAPIGHMIEGVDIQGEEHEGAERLRGGQDAGGDQGAGRSGEGEVARRRRSATMAAWLSASGWPMACS